MEVVSNEFGTLVYTSTKFATKLMKACILQVVMSTHILLQLKACILQVVMSTHILIQYYGTFVFHLRFVSTKL
jgi:hypothetical protein